MLSVSPGFRQAAIDGATTTQVDIRVFGDPDFWLRNKDFVSESMTLTQAISDDDDLRFGGCIASMFEIDYTEGAPIDYRLVNKYITVFLTQTAEITGTYPGAHLIPGENRSDELTLGSTNDSAVYPNGSYYRVSVPFFSGEIESCSFVKNRLSRHLVAYDRMYWTGSLDCTTWYSDIYDKLKERDGSVTLGSLRDALLQKYRIRQSVTGDYETHVNLPADSLSIAKIEGDVTVGYLMSKMAELAGLFFVLDGWGNLRYVFLGSETPEHYEYYMNAEAAEFSKQKYDGWAIPGYGYFDLSSGDTFENLYLLENDMLTAGRTASKISDLLRPVKSQIALYYNIRSYTPSTLRAPYRLWVTTGDRISFDICFWIITGYGTSQEYANKMDERVDTYVLSRRITGIQAITDEITARGSSMRLTEDGQEPLQEETQEVIVQ